MKSSAVSPIISKTSFTFLRDLAKNNNRDWFADHKNRFDQAQENIIGFADALLLKMRAHDHIQNESGKKSVFRIYRDVRFSKDKSPYKSHFSGYFRRATKYLRGGYYFHLEPGNSYVAGGFFGPNTEDMKRIRTDIDLNHDDWKKLFAQKKIVNTFGKIRGEKLSTAPRGFAKDHPGLQWLQLKQFILRRDFTDKEVHSEKFVSLVNDTFRNLRPFFDYMSDVLTTDANGNSLFGDDE